MTHVGDIPELQSLIVKMSKEPVFYRNLSDCSNLIDAKFTKMPSGVLLILETVPEFFQESPVWSGKTLPHTSTSARMVFEIDLDGSIASAAAFSGNFSTIVGNRSGFPVGKTGLIERIHGGLGENVKYIAGKSSSIGASLIVVSEHALNMWPNETGLERIHEDMVSVFLNFKASLVPFGSVVIISEGDSCLEEKVNLDRVSRDSGMRLVRKTRSGHSRVDWMPPVPRVQKTPSWSTPVFADHFSRLTLENLRESFLTTLEKTPQRAIPMSSRLARVRRSKPIDTTKPLADARRKQSALLRACSGGTSRNFQEELRLLLTQACSEDTALEEDAIGFSGSLCN